MRSNGMEASSPAETSSAVDSSAAASLPGSSSSARALCRGTAISGREAAVVEQQREDLPDVEALDAMVACLSPEPPQQEPVTRAQQQPAKPVVPGSSAETVSVTELWNSQMRLLLQSAVGPLKSFCHSTFTSQARRPSRACTLGAVWPLPLPCTSTGKVRDPLDNALNSIVIVLNWLHLGGPSKVPDWYSARSRFSGEQRGILQRLKRGCQAWRTCPDITASDMGRTAGKVQCLQETLATLTKAAIQALGSTGSGRLPAPKTTAVTVPSRSTLLSEVQLAKEIEADRLTFGGTPTFDPTDLLNSETKKIYVAPMQHSTPPNCYDGPTCKGHVRGSRPEVLRLLRKLDSSGRMSIFYPHQVRMQHRAGLFSL